VPGWVVPAKVALGLVVVVVEGVVDEHGEPEREG
jgi:hypothetical protein